VAALLGKWLMPWQQHVLDVALEVDPDTGHLVYRQVVVTVPRQSGKTIQVLCLMVHRSLGFGTAQRVTYTAQTRLAAREKWQYDHIPTLQASPLSGMFDPVFQRGEERIVWHNGSIYGIESSTETAGHGNTIDLGVIDEAFAQEDARLEQAMRPAMITRPGAQLWVVSTAGRSRTKSAYLWGKIEAGRARRDVDLDGSVAYFEWSAPLDADPVDPATWWDCMPALGHTQPEAAMRAELESMDLREFRRAYLNQWQDQIADEWNIIPEKAWLARTGAAGVPDVPVAFALAVAWPDAEFGSIAVAGRRGGELLVQVADHRPGTSWMVDRAVELQAHGPCAFVVDPGGPAGRLIADLEAAGVELVKPSMREVAQAAGQFYSGVAGDEPYVRHYDQSELSGALAAVQKRPLGDAWTWARKGPVDVSPLEAVTLAAWGHATRAHLTGQPFFAAYR
jgi:hypothetical protein